MSIKVNGKKIAGYGIPGKSAYEAAVDGGYTGTEEKFQAMLAGETWAPATHASQHASSGSDPITPASIGAVNNSGDTMTGVLKVPSLDIATDKCGGFIYGETNSLNFRGGNPSTESYSYMRLDEGGLYVANGKVYHSGNKPTPADIGITSGTTDLTAGSSSLATGNIYLVYE